MALETAGCTTCAGGWACIREFIFIGKPLELSMLGPAKHAAQPLCKHWLSQVVAMNCKTASYEACACSAEDSRLKLSRNIIGGLLGVQGMCRSNMSNGTSQLSAIQALRTAYKAARLAG